jgi:threonine dehydrogenase-like Zn-dependent dehydrogenase
MECVGTGQAMDTAFAISRPGSVVGYVGVPHGVEPPVSDMFFHNKGLRGGSAPVRAYIPELLDDVLNETFNPGRVFDFDTDLNGVAEAYAAMDERRSIKSLLEVSSI